MPGIGAQVEQVLRAEAGDRLLQVDVVPVDRPGQALGKARRVDEAAAAVDRGFRPQVGVAADGREDRAARVVALVVAGRHPGTSGLAGAAAVAGVNRRQVGLAQAGIEFVDRGRPKALRPGGAQHQVVPWPPDQAELAVGGVAERVVARVARRGGQLQLPDRRKVRQQRHVELDIGLFQIVGAGGRQARRRGGLAAVGDELRRFIEVRAGLVVARFLAVLDATGERQHSGRQLEQVAGEVGGEVVLFGAVVVDASGADVVGHLRGDGAEDVQRHAVVGRAAGVRSQCQRDLVQIDLIGRGPLRLVLGVRVEAVPRPAVGEIAFESRRQTHRVHVLRVDARPQLGDHPHHLELGTRALEVHAERVVRVVGRNRHAVAAADAWRCRREALARLARVVQAFGHEGHRITDVEAQLAVHASHVQRADQGGVRLVVVDVGVRHVEAKTAVAVRHERLGAEAIHRRAVAETARRRVSAQALQRHPREIAMAGKDLVAAGDRRRHQRRTPVAGLAPQEILVVGETVALVGLADIAAGLQPVELAEGDDVDHAGDRVGAVDGGGAIQQHFDPLDRGQRNRVQVDKVAKTAGTGAVHPAPPVDQNQRAVGAQVAQVQRAGAMAGAARAGRVEAGTYRWQLLQQLADRDHAGSLDLVAFHGEHRAGRHLVLAADARADHADRLQRLRLARIAARRVRGALRIRGRRHSARRQRARDRHHHHAQARYTP